MKIETYRRGKFQIVKIQSDNQKVTDLFELEDLIKGYLKRGEFNIAVCFTDASYIYSGAIRLLINWYKLLEKEGGTLCIIEPNPGLYNILDLLNIARIIKLYTSEDALPQ